MAGSDIILEAPALGLIRSHEYQRQPPYSTPGALNVRMMGDPKKRRRRIGPRPGFDRVMLFEDGDLAYPIQFLTSVGQAARAGWSSWWDRFDGTEIGPAWDVTPWGSFDTPAISDRRIVVPYNDEVALAIRPDTFPELCASKFLSTQSVVAEIWISPYLDAHWGAYRLYLDLDSGGSAITTTGIVVELILTGSAANVSLTGSVKQYGSGTTGPTNTNFSGTTVSACAGMFSVHIDRATGAQGTLKAYWRGALLATVTLALEDHDATAGFGASCTQNGGKCFIDRFRLNYLETENLTTRRSIICARNGKLYREDWPGKLVLVENVLGTQPIIEAAEYFQRVFIADRGAILTKGERGTLIAGGIKITDPERRILEDFDFTDFGIDPELHVVEITPSISSTDIYGGSYRIASVAVDGITLVESAGGNGTAAYRVVVAPKVYSHGVGDNTIKHQGRAILEGDNGKFIRDYSVDDWVDADPEVVPGQDVVEIFDPSSPEVDPGSYPILSTSRDLVKSEGTDGYINLAGTDLIAPTLDSAALTNIVEEPESLSQGRDVVVVTPRQTVLHTGNDVGRIDATGLKMYSTSEGSTQWADVVVNTDAVAISDADEQSESAAINNAQRLIVGKASSDFMYYHVGNAGSAITFDGNDKITILGLNGADDYNTILNPTGDATGDIVRIFWEFGSGNGSQDIPLHATQQWASGVHADRNKLILQTGVIDLASVSFIQVMRKASASSPRYCLIFSQPILMPTPSANEFLRAFGRCDYDVLNLDAGVIPGTYPINEKTSKDLVGTQSVPLATGTITGGVLTWTGSPDYTLFEIVPGATVVKTSAGTAAPTGTFAITAVSASGVTLASPPANGTATFVIYNPNVLVLDGFVGQGGYCNYTIKSPAQIALELPLPGGASGASVQYRIVRGQDAIGHDVTIWRPDHNDDGTPKGIIPNLCELIMVGFDRLFLAAAADFPHIWKACRQGDAYDWDESLHSDNDRAAAISGAVTNAGNLPQPIRAMFMHTSDYAIFAGANTFHVSRGDPGQNASIDRISNEVGIVGPRAWCHDWLMRLYWLSYDGIFTIDAGIQQVIPLSKEPLPDELMRCGPQTHRVVLTFDREDEGIWIDVETIGGTPVMSFWFDVHSGGFWPMSVDDAYRTRSSLSDAEVTGFHGEPLFGGVDGIIRTYDRGHGRDAGSTQSWYWWYGPIRGGASEFDEGIVEQMVATLAAGSSNTTWGIYGARSPEAVLDATAFMTGTWRAGRNLTNRPRMRAGAFGIKVSGTTLASPMSMEALIVRRNHIVDQRLSG